MKLKGLYAGSFDPMTNGHYDVIKRASKLCDELVVGVIANPQKKPLFDIEMRKKMLKDALKDLDNVTVECFDGLLANYVNKNKFDIVVRGLRSGADFDNEIPMAQVNAGLYEGDVETIFLMTSPQYAFISSSMVKEVASLNGDVAGLVPENVCLELKKINE